MQSGRLWATRVVKLGNGLHLPANRDGDPVDLVVEMGALIIARPDEAVLKALPKTALGIKELESAMLRRRPRLPTVTGRLGSFAPQRTVPFGASSNAGTAMSAGTGRIGLVQARKP